MTVFIPDLSEEDNQAEIEKIEGLITAAGGTMTETLVSSPWGRRRLAYTIRFNGVDYRDGFYTLYHFDMRPAALSPLERELKLDTNLMRYLLVHDDPKAGEKFNEGELDEAEGAEGEGESPAAATGEAAGGATAQAAQATAPAATEAPTPATEEPAATAETEASAPAAEEPSAAAEAEAESVPAEEAPATETVTNTAPPAADAAPSGDETEKE
jgi:small subunit ribosomal protein S6